MSTKDELLIFIKDYCKNNNSPINRKYILENFSDHSMGATIGAIKALKDTRKIKTTITNRGYILIS